ncbi:MAG: hypothetical protein QF863_03890, partial [Pseudomonadales bacterium]|nr:hypothetical protein [Pseudomonadales bacterium]
GLCLIYCGFAVKPHRSTDTGRIASGRRRSRIWPDGTAGCRSAALDRGAAAVLGMSLVCGLSPAQGAGGLGG